MLRLLLLVTCIPFGICHFEGDSSILASIPDIIGEFCPGANVCRDIQSFQSQERTFRPGFGSCCAECSCESDCAENGNCCFPNNSPHHYDNHSGLDTLQKGRDCLFPTTVQPIEEERIFYQSYYMVSSVAETYFDNTNTESTVSCGDENVAPWGSLYPVYSAKKKQIYKNKACATALGVTDGVLWDAVLTCDGDKFYQSDVSTSVLGLDSNSIAGYCAVHFIFPGEMDNLQALSCYVSPIDRCSGREFQMPDGILVSKEVIIQLCSSGFMSPYRANKLYANVFCHICNGELFIKEMFCSEIQHASSRGPYHRGFIGLIDRDFINSDKQEKFEIIPEIPMACDFKDPSRCRPVLCPSGQLRDRSGKCKYPNKIWYDQEYKVLINLTSEETVNITEILHVKFGDEANILQALKSPWPRTWLTDAIFYRITDRKRKSTHFVIALKTKLARMRPQYFVQNLKRLFKQDWMFEHNNATIVFKSCLLAYTIINTDLDSDYEPIIDFGNNSKRVNNPRYQKVYYGLSIDGNIHLITKLYFCYQVELIQSDFILSTDKTVLFNVATRRVLFDGEFVLIPSDSDESVHARVCIEDSGMYKMNNDTLKNTGVFHGIYVQGLIIIALLCIINTYFSYFC